MCRGVGRRSVHVYNVAADGDNPGAVPGSPMALIDVVAEAGASPPTLGPFIDGRVVDGDAPDGIDVFDPATGRTLARIADAADAGVAAAVAAGGGGFAARGRGPARARGGRV